MSKYILHNESNIPLLQTKELRDGQLVFTVNGNDVYIPWPKSFLHPYVPIDYSREDSQILKNYLGYRNISPQKTKKERIKTLEEWDCIMNNRTSY
jgi:hypothetical protein